MTKGDFRKLCLERLLFFSRFGKIKKDKTICSNILNIIDLYKPKKVLLYIPIKNEVDVRSIINILRKRKLTQVYVPYIDGKSFVPVKYRLPLKKGKFGIKEPKFSPFYPKGKIDLDMIIVPIVGVDKTFKRVGFGAGMYDRFYEKLSKKPVTIFTQLKLCKTKEIVTDKYDIGPNYIVSM